MSVTTFPPLKVRLSETKADADSSGKVENNGEIFRDRGT